MFSSLVNILLKFLYYSSSSIYLISVTLNFWSSLCILAGHDYYNCINLLKIILIYFIFHKDISSFILCHISDIDIIMNSEKLKMIDLILPYMVSYSFDNIIGIIK